MLPPPPRNKHEVGHVEDRELVLLEIGHSLNKSTQATYDWIMGWSEMRSVQFDAHESAAGLTFHFSPSNFDISVFLRERFWLLNLGRQI